MKLILNLVIYALLFYAVWFFFPDTFHTIVTWVADLFDFLKETIHDWQTSYSKKTG